MLAFHCDRLTREQTAPNIDEFSGQLVSLVVRGKNAVSSKFGRAPSRYDIDVEPAPRNAVDCGCHSSRDSRLHYAGTNRYEKPKPVRKGSDCCRNGPWIFAKQASWDQHS
jgi:hypothetical protein